MRVLVLFALVALASAAVRLPPIAGRGGGAGALNPTPPKEKKEGTPAPRPTPSAPSGPPADVVLIAGEQLAVADGANKVWNSLALKVTSDPATHDRFMVLAPVCPGSPACSLDAAAQREQGLLMGGSVGKWDCITVGKTATGAPGQVLQEFQVKFKSAADGSSKATTFYSKGNSEHVFNNICWFFHAVPFKAVSNSNWDTVQGKIELPSTTAAPDTNGRMYPGWEGERNPDTAFCWAFEFESNLGKTKEILNYYRPPFTPNAKTLPNADQAWKAIPLEDKVSILHCKKGNRKSVYEARCDALSESAKDPALAASIIEFVTQMRKIDFESVVRCESDCRSTGAADIPVCNELFTAHGQPVLFFAAPHMHQEVTSPVTFEVMHERCETDWNKFSKEVQCMDAIYGPDAKSMHLHTSMRMSTDTQQTKAAAALMIFFGDILFAGKIRDDADASYMSAPSNKSVSDLFTQIDQGYMLVEAKNHADGSAWGEFKKARNALRAHLYGPYRFGFELRAGTTALSKLAGINTALKDLRPDNMPVIERVTKGSLVMVKALCTILAQRNFGPNTPVRLLKLPIPGLDAPPPAGYTIASLYHNVRQFRNVGDCEKGTSCPFTKPSPTATSPRKACGAETLQKLTVPVNDIWVSGQWGRAPTPAEKSAFTTARVSMSNQMGAGKCSDADDGAIIPEIVNLYKKSSKFETFLTDAI